MTTKVTTNCGGRISVFLWMEKTKNTQAVASAAACKAVAVRLACWISEVLLDLNQQPHDLKQRHHIASRRATLCPPPAVYERSSTVNSGGGCARTRPARKNLSGAGTARGISVRRATPCARPPARRRIILTAVGPAVRLSLTRTRHGTRKPRQTTGWQEGLTKRRRT